MEEQLILGVEGGGTKTDWILLQQTTEKNLVLDEGKLPPTNFRLVSESQLIEIFRKMPAQIQKAGVFLAGCITPEDRAKLHKLSLEVWPDAHIVVGSDRDSGLSAAFKSGDGIIVISGTGSAVTGRKNGKIENAGGRGHLLGDRGGGYFICMEGLRLALRTYDLEHHTTQLASELLRALMLNRMEDLIAWTQGADKMSISRLLPVMFEAAQSGDQQMLEIIQRGAESLAEYTQSVARWLDFDSPDIRLLGGVFQNQPIYVRLYQDSLPRELAASSVELCSTSGALGAAWLAQSQAANLPLEENKKLGSLVTEELKQASTEHSNPRSVLVDQMRTPDLINLFLSEEESVTSALESKRKELQQAVDLITSIFRQNGRLFYVGAGTSGRLGALDASEIPPTFGEAPDRVQAIIAGGVTALYRSVEGAEDNESEGVQAIIERRVNANDAVCGITASGRTPFVLAALNQAKQIGAKTLLLTCNPQRKHTSSFDLEIDLPTGPELLSGSTRLKAGTATKIVLNILTTCSFIKLGRVKGNLMIDIISSNSKLRQRAIQIVMQLKNVAMDEAQRLLENSNWNIREVLKLTK
jgi:N-acetylmuramic acid 6-phosphate etherase